MDGLTLVLMAVGLSMDAFAVSIGNGMTLGCRATAAQTIKIAGAFGLFQGLMPMIGYLIADLFAEQIVTFDHWIAFILLAFIGGKMVWEVWHESDDEGHDDPTRLSTLFVMAVATSIDALAVGVTMALNRTGWLAPSYGFAVCSAVIAVVTFLFCTVGVKLGCKTGAKLGNRAQIVGGLVLIGIGVKILLEHLLG